MAQGIKVIVKVFEKMQLERGRTGLLRDVGGKEEKRKKIYNKGGSLLSSTRHGKGPVLKEPHHGSMYTHKSTPLRDSYL